MLGSPESSSVCQDAVSVKQKNGESSPRVGRHGGSRHTVHLLSPQDRDGPGRRTTNKFTDDEAPESTDEIEKEEMIVQKFVKRFCLLE